MTVRSKNFSGVDYPDLVDDTEYESCNFSMSFPVIENGKPVGHRLGLVSGEYYTFENCNFINREPPVDSIMINCNTTIKEFCVEVDLEVIEIDEIKIMAKKYADVIYGRYDKSKKIVYLVDPLYVPCDMPEE